MQFQFRKKDKKKEHNIIDPFPKNSITKVPLSIEEILGSRV